MNDLQNEIDNKAELVYENILLEQKLGLKLLCSPEQHQTDLQKLSVQSLEYRVKQLQKELEAIQ